MILVKMCSLRAFFSLFFVFLVIVVSLRTPVSAGYATSVSKLEIDELNEIILSNIMGHIHNLSSLGTRVTGYLGCERAADYIKEQFRSFGLKVEVQEYPVLIPIDRGANITVQRSGEIFEAYPLWPNMIQCSPTPPEGITAPLIYVGSGDLEDFDGKRVEGSIVLMDFNSLDNWLNALKLGAKAVIFIEPEETVRMEAESKVILTPVYFPRVYVSRESGERLKELAGENATVTLRSSMRFEWRTGRNIIGILDGEKDNEIIILAAHYDSWSPVPSKAPGAFDAVQISTLLEIARVLSETRPKRTVWFLALSGHYQNVMGAREFVEKYYFQNQTYASGQKKILAFIDLYLATDGKLLTWDYIHTTWAIASQEDFSNLLLREYIPDMERLLNKQIDEYILPDYLRDPFAMYFFPPSFDSEPVSISASLGVSFITMKTLRTWFYVPINEADRIEMTERFGLQVKFIYYALRRLANDDLTRYNNLDWRPALREFSPPMGGGAAGAGFVTVKGRVIVYDYATGLYTPVPNAFVVIQRTAGEWMFHPIWGLIITKADEDGFFTVHGLEHKLTGIAGIRVFAFVVDSETAQITYAPDFAVGGEEEHMPDGHPYFMTTPVFRCESLTVFDMFDALSMTRPRKRLNTIGWPEGPPIEVREFAYHSVPLSWSLFGPQHTGEPLAIIFIPPKRRVEVLLGEIPQGILNNASEIHPFGVGVGGVDLIPLTGFHYLRSLWLLNEYRYSILRKYHYLDALVSQMHSHVRGLLRKAEDALSRNQYSAAYEILYNAWNMEVKSYIRIKSMATDIANISVAFFAVLLPFVFLFDYLVFMRSGKIRLITILATFILFTTIFYFIHPGFRIATSFWGSMLGIIVLGGGLAVTALAVVNVVNLAKRIRGILMGAHYTEVSRTGALLAAFSVGIRNMRKRKMRTILTLISIMLLTASFVALTSVSYVPSLRITQSVSETPYNGVLLKREGGDEPLVPELISFLSFALPDAIVVPRATYFPPEKATLRNPLPIGVIYSADGNYTILAVMGFKAAEAKLTGIDKCILTGRWFIERDFHACILPKPAAENLSVGVRDQIDFLGIKFTVVGIVDDKMLGVIYDLDGRPLNPKYETISPKGIEMKLIPWSKILILPYNVVRRVLDGEIYSIAASTDNEEAILRAASELTLGGEGGIAVYGGYNGKLIKYTEAELIQVSGSEFLTVPFVIVFLVILTTVLGSLYERLREILTYSAIGLSPLHVTCIFLAESIVFALVGGFIGYLAGVIGINLSLSLGGTPAGLNFNFSSSMVIYASALSFLASLAASVYPAVKAGRMVTPSLERKWKIKTKPRGDEWMIPLPFFANSREEARGVMAFIKEYMEIYLNPDVGDFWVREPIKFRENEIITLTTVVALAPYDSGFMEEVNLIASKTTEKVFSFEIYLRYIGGERGPWTHSNPGFVDTLRKQLLLWRGLKSEERRKYISRGEKIF